MHERSIKTEFNKILTGRGVCSDGERRGDQEGAGGRAGAGRPVDVRQGSDCCCGDVVGRVAGGQRPSAARPRGRSPAEYDLVGTSTIAEDMLIDCRSRPDEY